MIFLTHLAFGVLLGIIYLKSGTSITSPIFIFTTILIASLLPDIDLATSTVGRHLRPFNDFFQHRKFFHSIMFMMISAIGLAFLVHNPDYAVAFILGFSGHIFLDSLTPGGIYVFWPAKIAIKGKFRTGGLFDMVLLACFIVLSFYFFFSIAPV